jgi:hypothetical protein
VVDVGVLHDVDECDGRLHVLLDFQKGLALLVVGSLQAALVARVHHFVFVGLAVHRQLHHCHHDKESAEDGGEYEDTAERFEGVPCSVAKPGEAAAGLSALLFLHLNQILS